MMQTSTDHSHDSNKDDRSKSGIDRVSIGSNVRVAILIELHYTQTSDNVHEWGVCKGNSSSEGPQPKVKIIKITWFYYDALEGTQKSQRTLLGQLVKTNLMIQYVGGYKINGLEMTDLIGSCPNMVWLFFLKIKIKSIFQKPFLARHFSKWIFVLKCTGWRLSIWVPWIHWMTSAPC